MEYRTLGRSGLKVSAIALGTANFGGVAADARWGQLETSDAATLCRHRSRGRREPD